MPLRKITWTGHQCGWALWHITESEETLNAMAAPDVCPDDIVNRFKRMEWLCGRILLKKLAEEAGLSYQGLLKDQFGKPFLDQNSHHISLSHAYPYVAAQIDFQAVGIDVEQPKEKLLRIAPRVLNKKEVEDAGNDITKICIYWCAKEALYKIHGKGGISFSRHLNIEPFEMKQAGPLTGKISTKEMDQLINLVYAIEDDFVLVYTQTR